MDFNKLRNIAKNIGDKVESASFLFQAVLDSNFWIRFQVQNEMSPARRTSTSSQQQQELPNEAEGFICPMCMASFPDPKDLEVHFDREHNGGSNGIGVLKDEVQELQSTLKEEQFYSAELKKEVDRLSNAVQRNSESEIADNHATSEIAMYQSQITALSEAKDLRKFLSFLILINFSFFSNI